MGPKEEQEQKELLRFARSRLYPSLTHHSYLVLRRRRLIFEKWIDALPSSNLRVLDIGGRIQPYRPLLESRLKRYFAIDVLPTPFVDVVARGQELPFPDNTFDVALATGIFEYFPEPRVAADQIYRVLKPGGSLFVSVAAIVPRAVDDEHWHYLPAGLRYTFASFSKVEIVPEVTSVAGFFRTLAWASSIFAKYAFARWVVEHTLIPYLNLVGRGFEAMSLTDNDQMTGNYSVLVQK
jgi:SAM-dependent methyltransferase